MLSLDNERAIVAVIVRYGTAIDTRDWALMETCFSEDVRADYGSFGKYDGRAPLLAFMQKAHSALGPTLHRMSNFVVDGDSGAARARTYVDAILLPLEPGGAPHQGIGFYDDELVKTAHGWRIRQRRFTAVRIT